MWWIFHMSTPPLLASPPPVLDQREDQPRTAPTDRPWPARLCPGLDRLADAPGAVLCLMLALNALLVPYIGLDHDARLYAIQAVERVQPGRYADDLYLRFGSQ